jgi:hypothetical protein
VAKKISNLIPDYMVMGERGMADMAEMEMPLPDNTVPMMTGEGPFGWCRNGWHVLHVQSAQRPETRRLQRPGLVQTSRRVKLHLNGTGSLTEPARFQAEGGQSMPRLVKPKQEVEVQIRKPQGTSGHSGH